MDTSRDYINMCEKVVEVQKYGAEHLKELRPLYCWDDILQRVSVYLWMPKSLSKKLKLDTDEIIISIEENNEAYVWYGPLKGSIIWLPRQDQLQEMLDTIDGLNGVFYNTKDINGVVNISDAFNSWAKINWPPFTSMEQLWLAFIMFKKYGKVWDGEEWVKEKTR